MLYLDRLFSSGKYIVTFTHPNAPEVKGFLTAPIGINTASGWDAISEQGFASGQALNAGAQFATGIITGTARSLRIGAFTEQIWQGSEPVELSIQVGLVARKDAFTDVVVPTVNLLKYPLPLEYTNANIKPPLDPSVNEECTVVGSWFSFQSLVPVSVSAEWNTVLSKSGHPVSSSITAAFKTSRVLDMGTLGGFYNV